MVTKARQLAEFIANADVDSDEIATGAVSASKLADTLDLSSKTIVMPDVAAFNITSGDRVGIKNSGTDISGTSLDDLVVGAGTTLAGMVLDGGASNDTAYGFASAGTKVGRIQYINSSNNMVFQTNNANRMVIDGSGNVGIGNTSPAAKLDISNSSSIPYITLGRTPFSTYGNLTIGGAATSGWITSNTDGSGNSTVTTSAMRMYVSNDNISFYSSGSTTAGATRTFTERMRITSGGYVGIGTNSPIDLLTATGTTDPRIAVRMLSGGSDNPARMIIQTNSTKTTNADAFITFDNNQTGDVGTKWMVGTDASAASFKIAAADLGYFNGTYEYLTINSSGNVGIGRTDPIDKLNVHYGSTETHNTTLTKGTNTQGLWVTNANNNDNMAGIHLATGGGTHFSSIVGARTDNASHWGTHLAFYTHDHSVSNLNTAAEKMRITGDGNVGIGITSPHNQLTIAKSNNVAQLSLHRSGSNLSTSQGVGILNFDGIYNSSETNYGQVEVYSNNISGVRSSMDLRVKSTSGSMVTGLTLYGTNNGVVPIVGSVSNWGVTWDARTPFQVNGGAVAHETKTNGGSTIFSNNFYQNGGDRAISTGYSQGIVMNPNGSGAVRVLTTSGTNTAGNSFSYTGGPYVAAGGTTWTNGSDERLKNITGEISDGLSKVATLRAAEYTWNDDETNTPQVGLIAQDVQAVLPEVITSIQMQEDDDTQYLGIAYDQVIPLLVAALKEAKEKIETLEARVDSLEN